MFWFVSKDTTTTDQVAEQVKQDITENDPATSSSNAAIVPGKRASFKNMATSLMKLMSGSKSAQDTIDDIIAKARESSDVNDFEDTTSFKEILLMLQTYRDMLGVVAAKYVGTIDFKRITPTAIFYYLEKQDELKNPSWKRRMHRFCPGVDMKTVTDLNQACELALMCYADTVEEIRTGLTAFATPYELVYADVRSEPGKPAHFLAIQRDQKLTKPFLQVMVGVRGTKTVADALTDLLCDVAEYRGGQAHAFILNSGKYLAEKLTPVLEKLLQGSGKKTLKLTLIGHSLGAGAASIAGIELNDHPNFEVKVIGFGCPALLSKDLAEKHAFIETVVNDSDVVPRMSGIAVANLLLDIMELDWSEYANRDVEFYVKELQRVQPLIFNDGTVKKMKDIVTPLVERHMKNTIKSEATERVPVQLFPPGKCIHFYFDGWGVSGTFVPNDFFNQIDLTRRMIDDHLFFTGYQQVLLTLMRQHKKDLHFTFESMQKTTK